MKITYISWAAHCSRSDHTARELGGTSHMVYWKALGSSPLTVWLKYIGQALRTWRLLAADRPDVVFVMTPPVFAPLAVWIYRSVGRCRLVMDAHTAAFLHPRWRYFQWLQAWLSRRAVTTIVHNVHLKEVVERAGGHATLVADIPVRFDAIGAYPLRPGFNLGVVCSFNPDEPTEAMFAAAAQLPDVTFHVTGNPDAVPPRLRAALPPNVVLTGFLPTDRYAALLCTAQGVMALTTRDHTMLRGAWEAIYQGTPVIVSNWDLLRREFDEGALHVDNTPEDIVRAVNALRRDPAGYRAGAESLRRRKDARWRATREALRARISS
jgi:glycosyltransferase involved in cell wall biosynthesis